jgi:hypothetical protein
MKEIIIKVKFDDKDGYKGYGNDVSDLISQGLKNYMEYDLEQDGVIKSGWSVTIENPSD